MAEYLIIYNRLKKNLKKLKNWTNSNKIDAYRLYEKDIPEYPYLIDVYKNYVFLYEKGKSHHKSEPQLLKRFKDHRNAIIKACAELLEIPERNIILKTREKQKGKNQYEKMAKRNETILISEGEMKFVINLYDYLDSGLFLDHRILRNRVFEQSNKKKVLNLFSYTGSISVAAALGGGTVTTVDMSKTYIDWSLENFKVNEINHFDHKFIQSDVFQYLTKLNERFDIIILDPPSFSNSKRMEKTLSIQEDHVDLIKSLMSNLSSNGILYFSNNFTKFKMSPEIFEIFNVKDISLKSIPLDFRNKKIHYCFEITHN